MNNSTWTIDQILGMAPDHLQLKAAESAASADKWLIFGRSENYAWGEFSNNQKTPNRVIIALPHLGLSCDCLSRKQPCRHKIALAILLLQQPQLFKLAAVPPWVKTKQKRSTKIHESLSPTSAAPAYQQAAAKYQRHLADMQAGMAEFELWLRDLIHQGMASLTQKTNLYWRQMADRMVDAEAFETAKDLRRMAALPGSTTDWPEELLRRLGRLYLLTQGFSRYHSLSIETQADLRFAAGWFSDPDSGWGDVLHDSWLILGKRNELTGHRNQLRIWLWGIEHKKPALLILSPSKNDLHQQAIFSGTCFTGKLQFYPSAGPLRAHLTGVIEPELFHGQTAAFRSLALARASYGEALRRNPWLRHYPLLLQSFQMESSDQRWYIRDKEGCRLPLPEKSLHGWHLQSISQLRETALFGEWDGRVFQPLAIQERNRWVDMHTLRGVK